jgi:phosphatidylserine/phosphatidylglycerophosphate/cardiolipin synthase-like enzyme
VLSSWSTRTKEPHSVKPHRISCNARLRALQANGCGVYLVSGIDIREAHGSVGRSVRAGDGILQMKYLEADHVAIIGSANYTTSSSSNIEVSVLLEL